MLQVEEIHKSYPTPGGELEILHGVTFKLDEGESLAVMGPSGCGKSTLLQILGALEPPTSGTVTLDGVNPYSLPESEQALFRNTRVGFVFQDHSLLPQLTVEENVLTPLLVGPRDPEAPARARRLIEEVGLVHRLKHRPGELSGGEKQRVAIARALIRQPKLLLCDEPTGNLDQQSAGNVADLLDRLQRERRMTIVLVTHSQELAGRFGRRASLAAGVFAESRNGQ
ncbi:MAG: ABC transporter ATP-binding protein [Bryobacteraceae bacterium]|nr:ABC transporter ATP-binding protein [Bryobacteraceae bacterium]